MEKNQIDTEKREVTLDQLKKLPHKSMNASVGDIVLLEIYDLTTESIVLASYRIVKD